MHHCMLGAYMWHCDRFCGADSQSAQLGHNQQHEASVATCDYSCTCSPLVGFFATCAAPGAFGANAWGKLPILALAALVGQSVVERSAGRLMQGSASVKPLIPDRR